MDKLPAHSVFHVSNSMAIRYANYVGLKGKESVSIYCNRGTSGIDGCTSTAVGASFVSGQLVTLLTGDMAFFYDRNAFWHNYPLHDLRVVILNNHAGGIFGLIDGPGELPEREEFFETTQKLTAGNTAKDFNLDYYFCNSLENLSSVLKDFFSRSGNGKILEIETNKETNRKVFIEFKEYFK
jgi:2-succinyl-5-enolpyruvyl-6-hydroxy-3-cyclohexene-1-carboxylate synthase